jgi:hypothetical protein
VPKAQVKGKKVERAASKAKPARAMKAMAGVSRSHAGQKGGRAHSYSEWTKVDLMHRAREVGIKGRSTMTKDELVKALRRH